VSFVTVDALERELRRLEADRQTSSRNDIPDDPVEFARSAGIEPEGWQEGVMRSQATAQIILAGRRTGKSTLCSIIGLHRALTIPGYDVIFVAPSLDQAQVPFLMAISIYRSLGRPVAAVSERRTGLQLTNGSELRAMAAVDRSKRGFSASLLCVDEASRIEDAAYYGALLPSITRSAGHVMVMSTPYLNEGFFAETWHAQDDEWERTFLTAEQCEYFQNHPEKLQMVKSKVPEWYYRQEYLCEFLADEFSIFNPEDVARAARAGEDLETIEFEDDTW
jgi:phage terminase large subunit-like protein